MKRFLFLVFVQCVSAVIHRLNSSEYHRMPPIYHLDNYDACVSQLDSDNRAGVYCNVELTLVSDEPSELMTMIYEYSRDTMKHFNHSSLHYGICATKTCKKYLQTYKDLRTALEGCLNDTIWTEYKLKTIVQPNIHCKGIKDLDHEAGTGDKVLAAVIIFIIMLNIVGSIYDFYFDPSQESGSKFLLSFSIRRNWIKLTAPSAEGSDPRITALKGITGTRTMTTLLVIVGHSPLSFILAANNPLFLEEAYYNVLYHIIFNGTLIVQTYLILSGLLLGYNLCIFAEKQKIDWWILPKGILLRWLRLSPVYALILAISATWIKFTEHGPLWQTAMSVELEDCGRYWWWNLLYINNYNDHSQCMTHTWYLATDMQLYILGIIAFIFVQKSTKRKVVVFSLMFVIGVIIPGLHTYFQDLDAIVIISPETARTLFTTDPTFNEVYKRGHTNLPLFTIGLVLGYLVLHLQNNNADFSKYKKYRIFYWSLIPFILAMVMFGKVLYADGPRTPLMYRVAYATLLKPLYGFIAIIFLLGIVFKYEDFYRGILEWDTWAAPSRVSYCAYLVHVLIIRYYAASSHTLSQLSFFHVAVVFLGIIFLSFLIAYPLWLMVEAPTAQLVKAVFTPFKEMSPEPVKKLQTNGINNNNNNCFPVKLKDNKKDS